MRSIRVSLRVTKVGLLDWVRLYHAIYVGGVGAYKDATGAKVQIDDILMTAHLIFKALDCTIGSDINLYSRRLLLDYHNDLNVLVLIQSSWCLLIPLGRDPQAIFLFGDIGQVTRWQWWQLSALLLHLTLHIGDVDGSGGGSLRRRL